MTINIPVEYNTNPLKLAYLQKLEEMLRVIYNYVGTWHRSGLEWYQYNNLLPKMIKDRYTYTNQLSTSDWNDFNTWFRDYQILTISEKSAKAKLIYEDESIVVDVDSTFGS